MTDCLFCKFVSGEFPCEKVWEDDKHLAFLSIFPNTEGVTVVIPKQHVASYIFEAPEEVMLDLVKAAKTVAQKIDRAYDDVGRTGLIFEGFGVNHLHAKLFPMHNTVGDWQERNSKEMKDYMESYPGYLSSHDSHQEDAEKLKKVAEKIRKA